MSPSPSEVLGRIEGELRALWSAAPAPGQTPKARACTTNLVVVATSPALAERWVAIVDDVLLGIPARAIIVGLDPGGKDGLEAAASAVCGPSSNGEAVCSERVTLTARGGVCSRLASCIGTLCATDVPMALVWPGRVPADDPTFASVARDADRIVLDAPADEETSEPPLAGLARLMSLLATPDASAGAHGKRARPGIADLAWTRLAPWQEYCARMFDGPARGALAAGITRLEITQACSPGTALGSEAALLVGWLATRLGWKTGARGRPSRLVRPDGGEVDVVLRAERPEHKAAARGALLSVHVEASAAGSELCGRILRETGEPDAGRWVLELTARGEVQRIEQHVRLRGGEPARLLERTLHRPPHDAALAESVGWAVSQGPGGLVCA